jgi:hypothetical protein
MMPLHIASLRHQLDNGFASNLADSSPALAGFSLSRHAGRECVEQHSDKLVELIRGA